MEELLRIHPSSHDDTSRFFYQSLLHEARGKELNPLQLKYGASVLAHFAETSCVTENGIPTLRDLSDSFDWYVIDNGVRSSPDLLEYAGAQALFLAGFLRDQTASRGRHDLGWYYQLGVSFYGRVSFYTQDSQPARSKFFLGISRVFPALADVFRELQRNFLQNQQNHLLIRPQ